MLVTLSANSFSLVNDRGDVGFDCPDIWAGVILCY
jgi:hypothetical protein